MGNSTKLNAGKLFLTVMGEVDVAMVAGACLATAFTAFFAGRFVFLLGDFAFVLVVGVPAGLEGGADILTGALLGLIENSCLLGLAGIIDWVEGAGLLRTD